MQWEKSMQFRVAIEAIRSTMNSLLTKFNPFTLYASASAGIESTKASATTGILSFFINLPEPVKLLIAVPFISAVAAGFIALPILGIKYTALVTFDFFKKQLDAISNILRSAKNFVRNSEYMLVSLLKAPFALFSTILAVSAISIFNITKQAIFMATVPMVASVVSVKFSLETLYKAGKILGEVLFRPFSSFVPEDREEEQQHFEEGKPVMRQNYDYSDQEDSKPTIGWMHALSDYASSVVNYNEYLKHTVYDMRPKI